MSERLTRRDMLRIAGVAALGSALGTASVGGGLLYFSRSEPQPVRPEPARTGPAGPESAPPQPAPVAKAEPAPLPTRPTEKPTVAAIPARTAENVTPTSTPNDELTKISAPKRIEIGVSRNIDWGMVFHPVTILTIWPGAGIIAVSVLSRFLPEKQHERCGDCGSTNGSHYHS